MGRSKRSGFDALVALPWPVGIVVGIAGHLAIVHGSAWWLSRMPGMPAQGISAQSTAALAPLAWAVLALCWAAALLSFLGARRRRRLLDTRTDLDSLAAGGWRRFEQLVGEAFRRQGYTVEETGLGGADGGIDLILRRDGQRTLVQCKQWRRRQVGVAVVREMAGLLAHHRADAVKIVCIGRYTRDAERFAQGKPIALVDGEQLLDMIRAVQRSDAPPDGAAPARAIASAADAAGAACPRCGGAMVPRRNRRTGEAFLGCSRFPACRGSAHAPADAATTGGITPDPADRQRR